MSSLAPELVIFDCDGVLIDSEFIAAQAQERFLAEFGIAIEAAEINRQFTGFTDVDLWANLAQTHGITFPADMKARYSVVLDKVFREELQAIADVHDVVQGIKDLGLPICIASNSSSERLAFALALVDLWDAFAPHVFSASMVARGKPAPDVYLHAAASMGVPPARCLVVEDSVTGTTAARAAGMTTWGFTGARHCLPGLSDALIATGAERTFDRLSGILQALNDVAATA